MKLRLLLRPLSYGLFSEEKKNQKSMTAPFLCGSVPTLFSCHFAFSLVLCFLLIFFAFYAFAILPKEAKQTLFCTIVLRLTYIFPVFSRFKEEVRGYPMLTQKNLLEMNYFVF
jgi:Ni,Fe-hydrogenase I cytochrome b subunit